MPRATHSIPHPQHLEKEHQEKTKVKNIQSVELGRHEMDTWCAPAAAHLFTAHAPASR